MLEVMPFLMRPAPWMVDAKCRGLDTNLFFPRKGEDAMQAKAVCNGSLGKTLKDGTVIAPQSPCPVRAQCLAYAIEHPGRGFGVWGGTSERERRPSKARKERSDKGLAKPSRNKKQVTNSTPAHGTVAKYKLEMTTTGEPCEPCKAAYIATLVKHPVRRDDSPLG